MANDRPDDATGDSVTLARVHAFLAALLTFLGFGHVPDATVAGMLDELTGWLDMAKAIRRDPQGATARIWWDAFKEAWKDSHSSKAAESADVAAAEFGKRFLPVADDGRDTFDSADFEALRTECDRLDANIAILESRAEDLQQNLDNVITKRDMLLKTNVHHANEVENIRNANGMLKRANSKYAAESAQLANALDAVRVAINGKTLPDIDVANAVAVIVQERDALRAQLASAIVPLPKPERFESGQRWAFVMRCDQGQHGPTARFVDASGCQYTAFSEDITTGYFLGTEK